MSSALVVVGSSSHVLADYKPKKSYACILNSVRDISHVDCKKYNEPFELDLMNCRPGFESLIERLGRYDEVDIVFAAYVNSGLSEDSSFSEIQAGLTANCGQPVYFFQTVSKSLPGKRIRGVFISSIYAHVAPMPKNYETDSKINPLYYGVAKAGVEQGLRWLSVQNSNHTFNSIILGPMPKVSVHADSPALVQNLLTYMSSAKMVEQNELHSLTDYLLSSGTSVRGASFVLDGGYLCY